MLSKIEELGRKVFVYLFGKKEPVIYNWRPDFLKNEKTGCNLEIDIWYPNKKLAIEINGVYHEELYQKQKDILKQKRCEEEGIKLITIKSANELLNVSNILNIKRKLRNSLVKSIKKYSQTSSKKYKKIKQRIKEKNQQSQVYKEKIFYFSKKKLDLSRADKKQSEERKANLKRFLAQGKISQEEYNQKILAQ